MPPQRCSIVRSSDPSRDFQEAWRNLLGCLGLSPRREFRQRSEVPTVGSSDRPNKKLCSDLAFWISIRTVPNSWETWKIRLEEVFYWDKTTPSVYMRGSWPIELPSIQSSIRSIYYLYSNPFTLFSNPMLFIPWSDNQGRCPRLASRPRATWRCPCPDGVSPRRELQRFLC
jgi:hypothetical protein